MNDSNVARKLVKNSAWSLISAVSSKASLVLVGLIVARLLGPDAFGRFGLIQSVIVLLGSVVSQSISTAVSKHVSQCLNTEELRLGHGLGITLGAIVGIALLFALICFVNVDLFADVILGSPDSAGLVKYVFVVVVLAIFSSWIQGGLIGFGRYRSLALSNSLGAMVSIPFSYWMSTRYGVAGAVISMGAPYLCAIFLSGIVFRNELSSRSIKVQFVGALAERDAVLLVGMPVLLTGFMASGAMWLGNRVLVTGLDGFRALGIFSAALQWNSIFSHVSIVLGSVLVPLLVGGGNGSDRKLQSINVVSGWLVVLGLAIPFVGFADSIALLYGQSYVGFEFNAVVACVGGTAVLSAFKGGIARRMVAENLAWYSVFSNLIWASMFVIAVYYLRDYGAIGIGLSLVGSQVLHFILTMPFFLKKGLVPAALIFSIEALCIWMALPLVYLFSEIQHGIFLRSLFFIFVFVGSVFASRSLVRRCSKVA
jgi:O-antigen/teichoic acid export membrane protein